MRNTMLGLSVAFLAIGLATPAWAPHSCSGGCPNMSRAASAASKPAATTQCRDPKTGRTIACHRHYYRRGYWVRR